MDENVLKFLYKKSNSWQDYVTNNNFRLIKLVIEEENFKARRVCLQKQLDKILYSLQVCIHILNNYSIYTTYFKIIALKYELQVLENSKQIQIFRISRHIQDIICNNNYKLVDFVVKE